MICLNSVGINTQIDVCYCVTSFSVIKRNSHHEKLAKLTFLFQYIHVLCFKGVNIFTLFSD